MAELDNEDGPKAIIDGVDFECAEDLVAKQRKRISIEKRMKEVLSQAAEKVFFNVQLDWSKLRADEK
jgi:hypothetical protein